MTYREAYNIGVARLEASLSENPDRKLDARLLLEAACGTDYQTLLADGNERLVTDEEFRRYESMLERRSGHEPVAYILGAQDFMGLPFFVTRDVLIPNQDTENLGRYHRRRDGSVRGGAPCCGGEWRAAWPVGPRRVEAGRSL